MTPTIALFKKEFTQNIIFAPAMIAMCLLFQVAYYEWCYFFNATVDLQTYFTLAIVMTALYAGAAAALAYSTEHADNTFIFLRKMPISPLTIALGKGGWVVCGTLLVFLGNLFLALIWTGAQLDGQIFLAFGFGIVEALVWGLFWSTRCRSQVHALLAGYLCAAGTIALLGNIFQADNTAVVDAYIALLPFRAVVVLIVGSLALRGMLRWFQYESKPSIFTRLFPEKMTLRYPQGIQTPFFALVHQHIRHASLLYPLGIACMMTWSLVCTFCWIVTAVDKRGWYSEWLQFPNRYQWEWGFCVAVCVTGMVLFWATIFGPDQKNHSYRFLSRLGIHEGKVWWSRLLPALVLYSAVLTTFLGFFATGLWKTSYYTEDMWFEFWWLTVPMALAVWLTPVAVGAFISISIRSQLVGIALTAAVMALLGFWMMLTSGMLGCSPLWAALPIVLALLLGSRIRAAYWLRENFTWRSRLLPLIPVLTATLVIMLTIPPVRMYSVPDVSWEQIEAYFDKMDLPERPDPEKFKTLLQYVKEKGDIPPEYFNTDWSHVRWYNYWDTTSTYEEYVLLSYASHRREHNRTLAETLKSFQDARRENPHSGYQSAFSLIWYYSPWERVRADRGLRLYIVALLAESGGLQDEKAKAMRRLYQRIRRTGNDGHVLPYLHGNHFGTSRCRTRLGKVFMALNAWHAEHGTLPESLDALLGVHLDALPVHPFTRAALEFHVNSPPLEKQRNNWNLRNNTYVLTLGGDGKARNDGTTNWQQYLARERNDRDTFEALLKRGGTYLRLGDVIFVIEETEK
jgi:hypothetical protein